jgi:hypothetical protein
MEASSFPAERCGKGKDDLLPLREAGDMCVPGSDCAHAEYLVVVRTSSPTDTM